MSYENEKNTFVKIAKMKCTSDIFLQIWPILSQSQKLVVKTVKEIKDIC